MLQERKRATEGPDYVLDEDGDGEVTEEEFIAWWKWVVHREGGAKHALFEPFLYYKRSFHQDRLGTYVWKTQKGGAFTQALSLSSCRARRRL